MELSPAVEIRYFLLSHVLSWKSGSTFYQIHWATNLNIEQAVQPPVASHSKPWWGKWWQLLWTTRVYKRGREKKRINTGLFSWAIACLLFWLYPFQGSPIFITQYPEIRPYCFLDFAMEKQYKASSFWLQLVCLPLDHLLYLFIQPATQLLKLTGM